MSQATTVALLLLPLLLLAAGCDRQTAPGSNGKGSNGGAEAAQTVAAQGGAAQGDAAPGDAGGAAGEQGAVARGAALFAARCGLCHKGGGQGPELGGIIGRAAAAMRGFPYSRALRSRGVTWDARSLDEFLKAPTVYAPGTLMVVAVPEAPARSDLIAYLATLPPPEGVRTPVPLATVMPAVAPPGTRSGAAALADYRDDGPGVRRRIRVADLPAPFQTPSARNPPLIADPPAGTTPHAPPGFTVTPFAQGLEAPRLVRVAPNGDAFVVESFVGTIKVLRPNPAHQSDGAAPPTTEVFAKGLDRPFGIAFYPAGDSPKWLYVANNDTVVRFPYSPGDLHAAGPPEVIVPRLTGSPGGHWTRDVAFSKDGASMYVSVGSGSNVAEQLPKKTSEEAQAWEKDHGLGATWSDEEDRADVLVFDPSGGHRKVFAAGIRNCVGLALSPAGDLWCSTNERDGLGDNLVPDYVTRVRPGAFYGWPWYYLGDHEDPRHAGERPDLVGKMTVPDVLLTPHSASLQMCFYEGSMFPKAMRGDAFAALHGSWNRAGRTGYKVVRVPLQNGVPTGEYEDFVTGFVIDDDHVWGRPVGVAVAKDGALYVTDDGSGTVWRVAYSPR